MDTAVVTFRPADDHSPVEDHIHDLRFIVPVVVAPPAPHGVKRTFAAFAFCLIALFVSAIVLSAQFTEVDGAILWVTVLMGAAIIALLIAGILQPFVKHVREHRRA